MKQELSIPQTNQIKVLMLDDDKKLVQLTADYLSQFQIQIVQAFAPSQAQQVLSEQTVDLILLDVMLPEMDGFQFLKLLRKTSQVPIIMLTARGETTDKVVGLELGADDYLPKPFDPRELVARIQSLHRRAHHRTSSAHEATHERLIAEDLEMNLPRRSVAKGNQDIELTSLEFDLLSLLMNRSGEVLDRDQIMDYLKGRDWEAFDRSIDIAISRLRTKIGESSKHQKLIKTIWGKGYVFAVPVERKTK